MKIFLARRSEPLPADTEECISEFADPPSLHLSAIRSCGAHGRSGRPVRADRTWLS